MEIKKDGLHSLREPKKVGGYLIIKDPTPEVEDLLKAMRDFKFNEGGISFRMICKPGQRYTDYDQEIVASVGWKLELVDRTQTLDERVKEIQ